jgi:hypothetical protein
MQALPPQTAVLIKPSISTQDGSDMEFFSLKTASYCCFSLFLRGNSNNAGYSKIQSDFF